MKIEANSKKCDAFTLIELLCIPDFVVVGRRYP
jgi:hypothetical protein